MISTDHNDIEEELARMSIKFAHMRSEEGLPVPD